MTHVVPRVEFVRLGPPTVLTVRLTPGMLPEDVTGQARRIARSMGAQSLRVEPRGYSHVLVTLLAEDPLATVLSLPVGPLSGPVALGSDEHGQDVTAEPGDLGHIAVQGATGSGKSVFLYSLLSQLAERDNITVDGIDPSGILLRPFSHSVLGLPDPAIVEDRISRYVTEMDQRISRIPHDRDSLPESEGLRFLVFEEYPGLLRYLDAADSKIGKRVRSYVARLLAEGRKAGIRVVLVAQRSEASVVGSTERGQCSTRISLRVDNYDAVKLLHPDADQDTAAAHASALPGVALVSSPGKPLTRIRSPFLSYSDYVSRVSGRDAA
ncbi:FtsK/SpoIIIE domain-containing protein [Pseudonocardia nematodicida]|uniref:FtsK/SpoIIIE domain-containing protein n=1 Tax=Pseudonocardia nematodicida TaxID=1206997 RepID=A0ABV1K9L8_9PSEU